LRARPNHPRIRRYPTGNSRLRISAWGPAGEGALNLLNRLFRIEPGEWPKLEKIRIAETARNIFEIKADEIK